MTDTEIIEWLEEHTSLSGVTRKISFAGVLKGQRVTVDIHDRGANVDANLRYFVAATREDGVMAPGNAAASTVKVALGIVHWNNLDTDK